MRLSVSKAFGREVETADNPARLSLRPVALYSTLAFRMQECYESQSIGVRSTVKIKLRSIINTSLERLFDFLLLKSFTNFGLIVREIRVQSYSGDCFQYNKYLNSLRKFYHHDAERYCLNNNLKYINELLYRRKELKNQSNYLVSVGVGIGTGIPVGLFVNNINKLSFLASTSNDGIFHVLIKIILVCLAIFLVTLLLFVILMIYKYFSISPNPIVAYSEEEELRIIEEQINIIVQRQLL